jgi:hypothetical protein
MSKRKKTAKRLRESRSLAERTYIRPKSVSARNKASKSMFESRLLAERVYIRLQSGSERNKVTIFVSDGRILAERVYIRPKSVSERKKKQQNVCLKTEVWQTNVHTLDRKLYQNARKQRNM